MLLGFLMVFNMYLLHTIKSFAFQGDRQSEVLSTLLSTSHNYCTLLFLYYLHFYIFITFSNEF